MGIEATGMPEEMGYCHCHSCRSYSGGPVTAFTLRKDERVRVTKGAELLGRFNKAGFSDRRFCTRCGGHVMTDHPGLGFTDILAAILPTVAFEPSVHLNYVAQPCCRSATVFASSRNFQLKQAVGRSHVRVAVRRGKHKRSRSWAPEIWEAISR